MIKPNPMPNFSELNLEITRNSFNVAEKFKHMTVEEIRAYQASISKPWQVMCLNITGDLNQGVIARSASAFGAECMWLIGRRKLDLRSTVGVENYLPIHKLDGFISDLVLDVDLIKEILIGNKLTPIFVEQGGESLGHFNWPDRVRNIYTKGKPIFVFGNEGFGIQENVLALETEFAGSFRVGINQIGVTRSLNVASAASITMHHFSLAMGWI